MFRSSHPGAVAAVLVACALAGCETGVGPAPDPSRIDLDPSRPEETFVLKSWEQELAGVRVRVALLGSNLQTSPTGEVSLDVQVANRSGRELYPDLVVWLSRFDPPDVVPTNADLIPPADHHLPVDPVWGFDYSDRLGEDGILSPEEVSAPKTWIFQTPDLAPFSFGAEVQAEMAPPGEARIGGRIFFDLDRNGEPSANEPPFSAGGVWISGPAGFEASGQPGQDGRYAVPVPGAGLYSVRFIDPTLSPLPLELTTPNPREVVLVPGADGTVASYDDAHVGIDPGVPHPGPRPIVLTERPPGDIRQDPWHPLDFGIENHLLRIRVGYGGCSPEHPLQLYMSGPFQESEPVRAQLILEHDDLGEMCRAWFEVETLWDLTPLVEAYWAQYGFGDGVVILHFATPGGFHDIRFEF